MCVWTSVHSKPVLPQVRYCSDNAPMAPGPKRAGCSGCDTVLPRANDTALGFMIVPAVAVVNVTREILLRPHGGLERSG